MKTVKRLFIFVILISLALGNAPFAHAATSSGSSAGSAAKPTAGSSTRSSKGLPAGVRRGERKVYYYLHDHLGGISAITDEQGNMVERRDYLPFGADRLLPDAQYGDYGFTGKEKDPETELYYYGARYYDPMIGRFISQDPWFGDLTDPQTWNKYSYALNNPLLFIDPTGLYIIETGEVEKGDTLFSITKQINAHYGTNLTYQKLAEINGITDSDKIKTGAIIRVGTSDGWQPPVNPAMGEANWNSLTEDQQKIMNTHKNFYQSALPGALESRNPEEWSDPTSSTAHNIDDSGNVEIRGTGERLGQQAVYDANGNLVTSPENMGTFDLVPPQFGDIHAHLRVDVRPWIEWGNSPADTTTRDQRIEAMAQGLKGQYALKYLGYDY